LEGTVIHKNGLITGGRSTRNINKKWNEKDISGIFLFLTKHDSWTSIGLIRARDVLLAEQQTETAWKNG